MPAAFLRPHAAAIARRAIAWIVGALVCALGAPGVARAAAPVELPPAEDASAWANPLTLAGLAVGTVADGPGVRIIAGGPRWRLWVRGEDGVEHTLDVAAPATRADREAVAAVAASLLRPVALPNVALPPLEGPTEAVSAAPGTLPHEAPSVAVSPADRRAPAPEAALPSMAQAPPSHPPPADPPIEALPASPPEIAPWDDGRDPGAIALWAGGGPSLRMRPTVRTTAAGGAWAGISARFGPVPVRIGGGIEVAAPAAVLGADDAGVRMEAFDVRGLAVWAPGRWELGPTGGASLRVFPYRYGDPQLLWSPLLGAVLAHRVPIGPLAVRIGLVIDADLLPTELAIEVAGASDATPATTVLQPVSAAFGISVWTH